MSARLRLPWAIEKRDSQTGDWFVIATCLVDDDAAWIADQRTPATTRARYRGEIVWRGADTPLRGVELRDRFRQIFIEHSVRIRGRSTPAVST